MKVLVTGGAGFIGSHLTDKLVEKNHKVVVVDNLSTGKKENINSKACFFNADICDFEKIKKAFKGTEIVFHLAALPRVQSSVNDPVATGKINILGTINVFKAAVDEKVKRVVFVSSTAVYGDQERAFFREKDNPNPISPYALQKLTGERFAELFCRLYNLKTVSLRYFNVYGPRIDFNSDYGLVVGRFLFQKKQGKPLTIFGTGEQTRDFCYVDDAVDALIKASQSSRIKGGEVINVSSGKSCSINKLANIIGGKVKYLAKRPGDILYAKADISLARSILKWKPRISLEQGIEKTKEWMAINC